MRIVVQLTPAAAQAMRTSKSRSVAGNVLEWLKRPLDPVHPGTTDSTLQTFFETRVDDSAEAHALVQRLQSDPSVDAAYLKPDDELPSM